MKKALVTGIMGQDGAYLAKLLLDKGYKVYGGYRRTASGVSWRLSRLGLEGKITLIDFDLLEYSNILDTIKEIMPDEVYNLAAQSFVGVSFKQPMMTTDTNAMGVLRILDAIKTVKPDTKFYQASTSEMFGKVQAVPQSEETPFYPRSPYGVGKLFSHWMTVNYRESYDMFATSGILFNHESPLRGEEFVTRKVTLHVAEFANGKTDPLEIGNMDAKRDWGYAKEYVEGMHLMLQAENPDTFVLATGETHTIRELIEKSFSLAGEEVVWEGEGESEVGRSKKSGDILVKVNPKFFRPAEVDLLIGDTSKAKNILGWEPETTFEELVEIMFKADLEYVKRR